MLIISLIRLLLVNKEVVAFDTSLKKEIAEMPEIIIKTVREVVREIVPDIARSVIREEIEKIKRI